MSNVLNISCSPSTSMDESKVIIQDDKVSVSKNNVISAGISIGDCFWIADTIISYTIDFPKNSVASFDPSELTNAAEDGIIMIAIKATNKITSEKGHPNDKLYYCLDDSAAQPLGKFILLSGTSENRIPGKFDFYNGTPNIIDGIATNGVYDSTLEIIVAL